LGWLGAAVCSVALVIAGGLVLSTVAVHRYLQASASQLERGESPDAAATPVPGELASLQRVVSALNAMPGVATATSTVATETAPKTVSYDVAVGMTPESTADEGADVVYAMTQELQNGRVNLELSLPANGAHAASVIEYRNAFDTPVPRSTVEAVSHAVMVASSVPGVTSVRVTVPYTWNLASGDLDVVMSTDDSKHSAALRQALARTALAGVDWSAPSRSSEPRSSAPVPSPSSAPRALSPILPSGSAPSSRAASPSASPAPTLSASPTGSPSSPTPAPTTSASAHARH
jgi:hypothetical protein